ncbi:apoptosis regulator R11-like isoform X3 [Asterias rubens]|uniref:apoptosis regulator R11-like isoform X3 n=1 Tax=Asterias rubens TaxID=7604 RepID=UPI001454E6AC|nr:apoptosis regulator R11-like isoform X3 [Asterias rubens]
MERHSINQGVCIYYDWNMNDGSTKQFIEDYCINRIRRGNIDLDNYSHVSREPFNLVTRRMREIGEEIENRNPEFFSGCCEQLQISETTAYAKFRDLADELFKDQENGQRGTCMSWGRIAAFITFSGRLALHCASNNMESLVPSVIGWTARYIDTKLVSWMNEHQGWNGFLEFFDKDRMQNRRETDILGDAIGTVLTYTAVGVGVVAGLAMFFKR